MKIGVNARLLLDGPLEGLGRYTFETVSAMAKANPQDEFVLFFDRKIESKYLIHSNMSGQLVYCPTRHPLLILFWYEILLPIHLKKHKISVFYSADNFLSLSSKVPTLLICHDLAFRHFPEGLSKFYLKYYQTFIPKYLKRAQSLGTVTEFVKNDIKEYLPSVESIFVAPNALPSILDNALTFDQVKDIEKPYFIYVGSIHPRKNIERMLQAFLQFNDENGKKYAFLLLGRNAWGTGNVQELLTQPNIHHINDADDATKQRFISKSIGLVYVSLSEGFGIPILEGFAAKVPVITSNTSSMPEVGSDAVLLVDPLSIDEIASAFSIISSNKDFSTELIENGNQRLKQFSWSKTGEIIYTKLKSCI